MKRSELQRDGYSLVRGFYSAEEHARMAAILDRHRTAKHNPTLFQVRDLLDILFNEQLLSLSRQLLEADPVIFPDIQINALDFWSRYAWHKDNVDRHDPTGPDWREFPYPILRFGTYLQNYTGYSGAVSMQPGSHLGVRHDLPGHRLASAPGDLALWYLTTSHSANTPSFRWRPNWAPVPAANRLLNRLGYLALSALDRPPLTRPRHVQRQVVFFAIGKPSDALARYLSYLLHRRYFYTATESLRQGDPLAFLSTRGFKVLNLGPLRKCIDPNDLFDDYQPQRAMEAAERLKEPMLAALRAL